MKNLDSKKSVNKIVNIVVKSMLGVMLLSLLFAVVYMSTGPSVGRLYEGDISLKNIYAPYDFTYAGDIDESKMKEAEEKALKNIKLVYMLSPEIEEKSYQTISSFFDQVRKSRKVRELVGVDEKLKDLKAASNLNLSDNAYIYLIKSEDIDYIESKIKEAVKEYSRKGVFSGSDKEALKNDKVKEITIIDPYDSTEKAVSVNTIPTLDEFRAGVERDIAEYFPKDKKLRAVALDIVKLIMSSNLPFSLEETEKRRKDVLETIPKVYKEIGVKKNEILIGKGEKVTKGHLQMLMQLGETRDLKGRFSYLIGMALLLIIFLISFVFHLRFYESSVFRNNKNLFLISLLVLFIAVTAQMVAISPLSSYIIPLASASMLIAILLNANSAFIFSITMSIFVGVVAGNNFGLMIVMFVGSSVGIYSVRRVRHRSKLLFAGFLLGIANLFTITALNLLNNLDPRIFLGEGLWGLLNGLISFLLVMGLLPIFEYLFKIPTDITLLELSDLNHPLLKAISTRAPGTYHHSIIVGNLAETACDAIGANSLLARVGAYYHDIGKIEKAEYFSENESELKNSRHENIAPSMSALVIINHVKDGVDLARKYKLNQALIDFIAQHHGNGLIYYFYQRALVKVEDENSIKEEDFRYPGPRPQSKETAIVLLADSVEASSRTLTNPTPSRVQSLVQKIVNNKFIDGQLDECNLTLKDLHKISEAFMRILNAMFHTRIEYPNEEQRQRLKNNKNNHKKPNQNANTKNSHDRENNKKGS